jgi:hypothetical protein
VEGGGSSESSTGRVALMMALERRADPMLLISRPRQIGTRLSYSSSWLQISTVGCLPRDGIEYYDVEDRRRSETKFPASHIS